MAIDRGMGRIMDKLDILIVDDEQLFIDRLKKEIVALTANQFNIISTTNGFDKVIYAQEYELYFLDIDLNDKTGFDLAKEIIGQDVKIVFVTNHNDLVYSSLEMQPFYFVRKDHLPSDLKKCLSLYQETKQRESMNIVIKERNKKIIIALEDILYFEKSNNVLYINLVDRKYTIRKSMSLLDKEINHQDFLRVHNSFIVNMNYISSFATKELIIQGKIIPISRTYSKMCRDLYHNYLRRI